MSDDPPVRLHRAVPRTRLSRAQAKAAAQAKEMEEQQVRVRAVMKKERTDEAGIATNAFAKFDVKLCSDQKAGMTKIVRLMRLQQEDVGKVNRERMAMEQWDAQTAKLLAKKADLLNKQSVIEEEERESKEPDSTLAESMRDVKQDLEKVNAELKFQENVQERVNHRLRVHAKMAKKGSRDLQDPELLNLRKILYYYRQWAHDMVPSRPFDQFVKELRYVSEARWHIGYDNTKKELRSEMEAGMKILPPKPETVKVCPPSEGRADAAFMLPPPKVSADAEAEEDAKAGVITAFVPKRKRGGEQATPAGAAPEKRRRSSRSPTPPRAGAAPAAAGGGPGADPADIDPGDLVGGGDDALVRQGVMRVGGGDDDDDDDGMAFRPDDDDEMEMAPAYGDD